MTKVLAVYCGDIATKNNSLTFISDTAGFIEHKSPHFIYTSIYTYLYAFFSCEFCPVVPSEYACLMRWMNIFYMSLKSLNAVVREYVDPIKETHVCSRQITDFSCSQYDTCSNVKEFSLLLMKWIETTKCDTSLKGLFSHFEWRHLFEFYCTKWLRVLEDHIPTFILIAVSGWHIIPRRCDI